MEFRQFVMLCQESRLCGTACLQGSEAEFPAGPLGEPERRDYDGLDDHDAKLGRGP